jgi:hypothetical protein
VQVNFTFCQSRQSWRQVHIYYQTFNTSIMRSNFGSQVKYFTVFKLQNIITLPCPKIDSLKHFFLCIESWTGPPTHTYVRESRVARFGKPFFSSQSFDRKLQRQRSNFLQRYGQRSAI